MNEAARKILERELESLRRTYQMVMADELELRDQLEQKSERGKYLFEQITALEAALRVRGTQEEVDEIVGKANA